MWFEIRAQLCLVLYVHSFTETSTLKRLLSALAISAYFAAGSLAGCASSSSGNQQDQLLVSDTSRFFGGLPCKRMGGKKFGVCLSLENQEANLLAGYSRKLPGYPIIRGDQKL